MTATRDIVTDQRDQFAFHDDIVYLRETKRGLTRETVEEISAVQGRAGLDAPVPAARLRALPEAPDADLDATASTEIDFDKIVYYRKPSEREEKSWDDVPEQIKATFERLGHPRGGAQVPRRRRRPVRLRGRLPLGQGGADQDRRRVHGHRPGAQGIPGDLPASTSARSSRPRTTSSRRSTARSGRAARSSTSPRASRSRCRCRPTSGSTARTPASSSGR